MHASQRLLAWFFAFASTALAVENTHAASSKALWRRVAEAPIIAIGTLIVPVAEIEQRQASGQHEYVDLRLTDSEILKGDASRSFVIRWYSEPRDYAPAARTLAELRGHRVILFAVRAGEYDRRAIYFAGYSPDAVSQVDEKFVQEVRAEIVEQRRLMVQFPDGFPPVSREKEELVRRLLDETTRKGKAEAAFEKLLGLGADFVPAIVSLMDDRRDVAAEWLTIPNSPEHWEAHALYKPEKVVDALDGILVKVTGVGFVSIVNGGSDENRRATVDAWRVYLYHSQPEARSGPEKGKKQA